MSSFDVQAFVQEQIALAAKSTPIPGWTLVEIAEGTKGAGTVGVGIIDMTDVRLQDPALRARCNAWFLALRRVGGKKGLKEICKQANLLIGGSVRVLTMRLAFSGKSPPRASASAPAASSSSSAPSPSAPSSYGGSGSSSSASSSAGPTTKKRSSSSSSSGSNKKKRRTAKSFGLTKEEWASVKLAPIKRGLKVYVKTLAKQVDDDWHDGYEEQGDTLCDWFNHIADPLQSVLTVGVEKKTALFECNEILKAVSDSWYDLCACPMRGTVEDNADNYECASCKLTIPGHDEDKFTMDDGVSRVWSYVWTALLRVHAARADVDTSVLLQCIKDATVNGVNFSVGGAGDHDLDDFAALKSIDCKALDTVIAERKWAALPNTRKHHRMRRAIDRRFNGPPERRTRSYHLFDDY